MRNVDPAPKAKPVVGLRSWYVIDVLGRDSQYHFCLCGLVYGHPAFPDGEPVRTSRLVGKIAKGGTGYVAETLNTVYTMDGPPKYHGPETAAAWEAEPGS